MIRSTPFPPLFSFFFLRPLNIDRTLLLLQTIKNFIYDRSKNAVRQALPPPPLFRLIRKIARWIAMLITFRSFCSTNDSRNLRNEFFLLRLVVISTEGKERKLSILRDCESWTYHFISIFIVERVEFERKKGARGRKRREIFKFARNTLQTFYLSCEI